MNLKPICQTEVSLRWGFVFKIKKKQHATLFWSIQVQYIYSVNLNTMSPVVLTLAFSSHINNNRMLSIDVLFLSHLIGLSGPQKRTFSLTTQHCFSNNHYNYCSMHSTIMRRRRTVKVYFMSYFPGLVTFLDGQ